MEKIERHSLIQIFKFSWICNILPYYGSLPKWMWAMNIINSKTKKIWEENIYGFMTAGKDLIIDQDLKVLEKIMKCNRIEDKLKLWSSFDYGISSKGDARTVALLLVDKGIKVLLKQSEKYNYKYNLSFLNEVSIPKINDIPFDTQEKDFEENDNNLWKNVNILVEGSVVMLSKEEGKIKVQLAPSHVFYIHIIETFSKYFQSEDDNSFNMNWGCVPTVIDISFCTEVCIKGISKTLNNKSKVNKIVLKSIKYSPNSFIDLLSLMHKINSLKGYHPYFQYGKIKNNQAQIDIYTDILVFIVKENKFPVQIDKNFVCIQGDIVSFIKIEQDKFLLLKLNYMCSKNFSMMYIQDKRFLENIQLISYSSMFSLSNKTYVLIKIKDVNKISNANSEELDIISDLISTSKIKTYADIDWTAYNEVSLIKKLNKLPNFVNIQLNNLYFWNEDIENKFWRAVLSINNGIIMLDGINKIKIKTILNSKDESTEKILSFLYWTPNTEVLIDFTQLWRLLKDYISKSSISH